MICQPCISRLGRGDCAKPNGHLRRIEIEEAALGEGVVVRDDVREVVTAGPEVGERNNTQMQLWGEVSSADGRSVSATMTTPDGYDVTVTASLGIVKYLLENDVEGGFYTPSLLMGADFATSLPGVSLQINS